MIRWAGNQREKDMHLNNIDKTLTIKTLAGMPHHAGSVINGMKRIAYENADTFVDREGNNIDCSNPNAQKLYAPIGYYMAAWDMRHGHIALDETGTVVYVRDQSFDGTLAKLKTWHAIGSFGAEYGVPKQKQTRSWERQLLAQAADLPRVGRGFRLNDRVFRRIADDTENGTVGLEEYDGTSLWMIESDPAWTQDKATRVEVTAKAKELIQQVTADEHSAANMTRMFACNFLEPYKHMTFVLYGEGGNGKGLLLNGIRKAWNSNSGNIDLKRLAQNSGFTGEQEAYKIIGRNWVFDEEADVVDERTMNAVKRISTGDSFNARQIGENASVISAKPTLVIATNNPVISDITAASSRRLVLIRMKDGQTADDLKPLRDFIREYGMTPFLYVSWLEWRRSDNQYEDVNIGDSSDMDETETWLRDSICVNGEADTVNKPSGMHVTKKSMNKMGLRRKSKLVDGTVHTVVVVKDESRFSAYRKGFDSDMAEDERQIQGMPSEQLPITGAEQLDPHTYGFGCTFTDCELDKKAIGWKSKTENGGLAAESALNDMETYATVPDKGFMVLDLDSAKHDGEPSGWELLNREVGDYGTDAFPKTYLVKTPHNGAHAYYRIPERLVGRIKNAAHPEWDGFEGGLPIDVRLERKGYVVGAMSITTDGSYRLVDLPDGNVPELSDELADWLESHPYMEDVEAKVSKPRVRQTLRMPDYSSNAPDMSPIPEGRRNEALHDWAVGRLLHYPNDVRRIHDDLLERGRLSGLDTPELETIWRHCLDYVESN